MAIDPRLQKDVFGRLASGISVVTTKNGDVTWGLTANSVTSLSLNPPLVTVSIVKNAHSHTHLSAGKCFAVNILAEDQEDLSNRFAKDGPKDFSDLETKTAVTGSPILVKSLAWVDCKLVNVLPGGDHDIFVGEIVAGEAGEGRPLLYFRGKYARLPE